MKTLNTIALVLIVIGGINWGLIGLFEWNLVAAIFGDWAPGITRLIYILVGVAALYGLYFFKPITAFEDRHRQAPVGH